ncbi:hypothetical protein BIW11_07699 [Tropilaelaps mercedesae]|uniref:Uncharacterized protein n=1 Tax=Tropilaelaps mercedesae TaxID=418985 RepID=A0A1V9XSU0_9ACAR|nr:hypothetical protein BIW11_07699 [Tropilaelaps mercedesae]
MSTEGAPVVDDAVDTSSVCGEGTTQDGYHTSNTNVANTNNNNTTATLSQQQLPTTTAASTAASIVSSSGDCAGGQEQQVGGRGLSNGHSTSESPHDSGEGSPRYLSSQIPQPGDPSLPNGEAKSDRIAAGGDAGRTGSIVVGESHIKTESPETASSEAMHSLVDTVIKQECLRRLHDGSPSATPAGAIVENGTTSPNVNGPCPVKPKLEDTKEMLTGTPSSQTPTNGDVPELSGQQHTAPLVSAPGGAASKEKNSIETATTVTTGASVTTSAVTSAASAACSEKSTSEVVKTAGTTAKPLNTQQQQSTVVVNGEKQLPHAKQAGKVTADALSLQVVLEYLRKHNLQ